VSTTTLYRAYDAADRLLYVGITGHLARRMAGHERSSAWYPECARVATTDYPSRALAGHYEDEAISAERPMHNVRPGAHDWDACPHEDCARSREEEREYREHVTGHDAKACERPRCMEYRARRAAIIRNAGKLSPEDIERLRGLLPPPGGG